jgi:rhomboid family GlyGly-CTERM serine protease
VDRHSDPGLSGGAAPDASARDRTAGAPVADRKDLLAWPLLCAVLGAMSVAVWLATGATAHEPLPTSALLWHPTAWWQRPWTLWTAALVHLTGVHLAANLLALGAVAVLGRALDAGRPATLAVLVAWPLTTLTLLAWPQVGGYGGLSGLIHAQVLVLWSLLAIKNVASPLAIALLAGTAFKLLMEHAWSQPQAFDPNWGFNVVYAAHLGGALVGTGCGVVGHVAAGAQPRAA